MVNSKKNWKKVRSIYEEYMRSNPNIEGTGRHHIRYSSGKFLLRNVEPNFLGKYYVSKRGHVYYPINHRYKEIRYFIEIDARKTRIGNHRSVNAKIRVKLNNKWYSLPRIVATVWVNNPNPTEYNVVMHLDNDKLNNHYTNLKWGTQSMNIKQASDECRLNTLFSSGINNPMYGKRRIPQEVEVKIVEDYKLSCTKTYLSTKYHTSRQNITKILKRYGY